MCEKDYVETADFVNLSLFFEFFKVEVGFFRLSSLFNLFFSSVFFAAITFLMTLQASFFNFSISFVFASLFSLIDWITLFNFLSFSFFYMSFLSFLDFCLTTFEFESTSQSFSLALIYSSLQIILTTSVPELLKLFIIFMINVLSVS